MLEGRVGKAPETVREGNPREGRTWVQVQPRATFLSFEKYANNRDYGGEIVIQMSICPEKSLKRGNWGARGKVHEWRREGAQGLGEGPRDQEEYDRMNIE